MNPTQVLQVFPSIESLNDSTRGRPKASFKNIKKIYHCPIQTCKYFRQEFHFKKIKFLKQHFVKVHKPKSFSCSKCGKTFPLEATMNRHIVTCGVTYRCYCNAEYPAYEALLTHIKRKHRGTTLKYKDMMGCVKAHHAAQNLEKQFDNKVKVRTIIVGDLNCDKFLYVKRKKLNNASKETQTGIKMCKKILPNISSPSQTLVTKTVSLQTSTEALKQRRKEIVNKGEQIVNDKMDEEGVISSATQTSPMKKDSSTVLYDSENTSIGPIKDFDYTFDSSPNPFPQATLANVMFLDDPTLGSVLEESTQTVFADVHTNLESSLVMFADSETQTAFSDLFDSSCIDTYTQTCESLFSDFNVDMETQTLWSIFDSEYPE